MSTNNLAVAEVSKIGYNRFLLIVAGLGGLLYGIDVGIIAGALPYLEATSGLNAAQLSIVVAAVLLGSVISTLFAGSLADLFGRKPLMICSGVLFVISVPLIALSHGYGPLVFGRLLQGISGGLAGVVVPLYLAECLSASNRGRGTSVFQWLLTLGIVVAAVIGFYFSMRVEEVEKLNDAIKLFAFKDMAWRGIFWVSLPVGILFVIGSFFISESPRWLFRNGKEIAARAALLRSRPEHQVEIEFQEMKDVTAAEQATTSMTEKKLKESLLHRKYIIPFLLACVILICNQTTGISSIVGYNTTILIQAGLSDKQAHFGYVILMIVNFLMTIGAVVLIDRKGRKFLLSLGSGGVIVSLILTATSFHQIEKQRIDCKTIVQSMVSPSEQKVKIDFDKTTVASFLTAVGDSKRFTSNEPATIMVIYSYGDYRAATKVVRSDDKNTELNITRDSCVPANKVLAFFSNPFGDLAFARTAPLKIENALIAPVPSERAGWLTAFCVLMYTAFFAIGPGVCVWLALSELMPTRIRSNGMSIALLINQATAAAIAVTFLPTVGKYGYSTMFFVFAGCTVIYFITATFFLPETKGKTLEEIQEYFDGGKKLLVRD
jgi:MFS family permease